MRVEKPWKFDDFQIVKKIVPKTLNVLIMLSIIMKDFNSNW